MNQQAWLTLFLMFVVMYVFYSVTDAGIMLSTAIGTLSGILVYGVTRVLARSNP